MECSKCHAQKEQSEFYFGRSHHCKECIRKIEKERYRKKVGYQEKVDEKYKKCTCCNKIYPATQKYFYIQKYGDKTSLRSKCKRCTLLEVREINESDVFKEDFCSVCGIRFGGKIKNAQHSHIHTICTDCFVQKNTQ